MAVQAKPTKPAATQVTTAVVIKTQPSSVIPWDSAEVTGFENVRASDLGIPFLTIVQKGSAEFDTTHQKYKEKGIEGVKPGDVINILTREIVYRQGGEPLVVVPVHWDKFYMEWKPRTASGGGVVAAHRNETVLAGCHRNAKNLDELPNGNVIVTTAYFHVVTLDTDQVGTRLMIGMSSTQLRKSRSWLNTAQSIRVKLPNGSVITPPLFSHKYELTTVAENNDKGSWYGWSIKCAGMITDASLADDLVVAAKAARATGAEDAVKASAASSDDGEVI